MNKLFLAAGMAALFSVGAYASPVTYSTIGSELCIGAAGCGVTSQTFGGIVTVSFSPIASSTVDPQSFGGNSTFGSFGEITVSCIGGGTACSSVSLAGLNLYINLTQTAPSNGMGSLPGGVITGSISGNGSGASITWPASSVNIGIINYSVANSPLALVPPSVNGGVTSVQAVITDTTVPEPGTYAMLASGLIGLGIARRRRS
jgi:hypothetical protein